MGTTDDIGYYLPNNHYDYVVSINSVAVSRSQKLLIDIEELKSRLLELFSAALVMIHIVVLYPSSFHNELRFTRAS